MKKVYTIHMLKDFLIATKNEMDRDLQTSLLSQVNMLESTTEAMHYMLSLDGKRLRPAIVMAVIRCFDGDRQKGRQFARAVEYLHTYTLIIDDIQDNSALRRGMPACHTRYGVNTAMLAAARLFERGLQPFHASDIDQLLFRTLCDNLHMGQAADLNVPEWDEALMTLENLRFIHAGKTSSLIQIAILGGCCASGLDNPSTRHLLEFGYHLGLAFQAQDDMLSLCSESAILGKPAGAMADSNKLTYARFSGNRDSLQRTTGNIVAKAKEALAGFPMEQVNLLFQMADHIIQRTR